LGFPTGWSFTTHKESSGVIDEDLKKKLLHQLHFPMSTTHQHRFLVLSLDPLADVAPGNVEGYLSLHSMPPKLLFHVLLYLGASWVNRVGSIMGLLQNELLQLFDIWDT
jgi:hypothetical protein